MEGDPATARAVPARWARMLRGACTIGCVAALVPLGWLDPERRQIELYLSWLAALVLYLLQWPRPRGLIPWRPSRALLVALAAYALALFTAFCLSYNDWRWAATADSPSFYEIGEWIGNKNPHLNLLSVRGIFEQCTVVQATLQNVFMHLSVSLFAHRLGNLLTSTLIVLTAALLAAYTSGATAGVLLGLFLPLNSVFVVFTMISYPNLSGVLPYLAVLVLFIAAWRVWESGFLWAALGLTCGLASYFLPLWLAAVASVSAGVVLSALYWRAPRVFLIWGGGVFVALLPGLLQLPTFLRILFAFRPMTGITWEYVRYIGVQSFFLPFDSTQIGYGADGPWLRPPFNYIWLAGLVLAALSGVLALARRPRGRVLRHAWLWLIMMGVDVAGLAMANSGYPTISLKRAIVMLPNMTFLLVLPLAWLAERVGRPRFTVALTIVTVGAYGALNAATLYRVAYGYTVFDGLVRLVQTTPGQILLVSENPDLHKMLQRGDDSKELLNRLYHVRDRTTVTSTPPERRSDFDRVVCFSRHFDGPEWADRFRLALAAHCPDKPVERITAEIECVTCDPP